MKLAVPLLLGDGIPDEIVVATSVTVGGLVGAGTSDTSVDVGTAEETGASEVGAGVVDEMGAEELAAPAATAGPTSGCSPVRGVVERPHFSPTVLRLRP